ncbi:MAG: hypothetical protein JO033_02915 [Acidobacteriaceae bacterium]|nr:hypothetical protein [Acidobacteriaceae bacterium]MBV9501470.1 hypothetical protein [Acidobacteriaceae bacterium]
MTLDEMNRAIELLVQSQQLMAKNLESLFSIAQQTAKDTAQNTRDIGELAKRLDQLAQTVGDYIRGLRNGQ